MITCISCTSCLGGTQLIYRLKLSRFSQISGHLRKSELSSFLWSQNGRQLVHRLHNILQSTFAPLTFFFVVSAKKQHSKIHLCRLAIPDNFHSFYYCYVNPICYFDKKSANGQSSNFPFLEGVLPGSTTQAVCNELQKTEAIN